MSNVREFLDNPMEWSLLRVPEDGRTGEYYRVVSVIPAPAGALAVYVIDDDNVEMAPVKYQAVCDVAYVEQEGGRERLIRAERRVLSFSFARDVHDAPDAAFPAFVGVAPSEAVGWEWVKETLQHRAKHAPKKAAP